MADLADLLQQGPSSLDRPWTAFVYGGLPLHHQLSDPHRAGIGREGAWPDFGMSRSPMVGARVQYEVYPYLALALEGWRHRSAMPLLNKGVPFTQEQMNLSPSLQGRLPLDTPIGPMTPYLGAGPVISRTEQSDQFGASPPGLDFGAQVYGGLEYPLSDRLRAMAELKWHRGAITPRDGEGAIHGRLDRLDALLGLGLTF